MFSALSILIGWARVLYFFNIFLGYFSLWEKALLQIGHMRIAFRLFRPAGESRAIPPLARSGTAHANANLGYFALWAKAKTVRKLLKFNSPSL